ncbi:methyltransferase domain-containing protein [Nonomuraea sp. NBC_01738]|uniref:putative RNA methyltransferase n=1 Tax=Nonomuraea sp. NBC_01738 TaxID=2976003 RepID=UPI002E0F44CF|nr:methyltransferase domain-containing protein [Nonomuraea sp. NBC_01738]
MLADVVEHLRCPVCQGSLALRDRTLLCPLGHAYDVAKQGYVSLLLGSKIPGTADTAEMVEARSAFLEAGHYRPLAEALARAVPDDAGLVVDAGAGTGYYLRHVLDAAPRARGLAFDVSKAAVRRAARSHGRTGAFVADVWQPLPIESGAADVVLDVFAPRNGPEFARILRPGGMLIVVTPAPGHLAPLVGELGLLSVDDDKEQRVGRSLTGFELVERASIEFPMRLGPAEVAEVVRMGPSAWHLNPEVLADRISQLFDGKNPETRAAFHLSIFQTGPRSSIVP